MPRAKLVTVYGGSGFLGRQITRILAQQGWRVRVPVRRPNLAGVVRTYGAPGQVEPVFCNVRDDLSVMAAMTDSDAVINCVGIMYPTGKNTFQAIHVEAAERISRIAAEIGVGQFVHVSALGANVDSPSRYAETKGLGEQAVLKHRPDAIILRPSIIFGSDDKFYNRLGSLSRMWPFMFVPGPRSEVQPVYVVDVAKVGAMGAAGAIGAGIYELAGPDVMSMRQVAEQVLRTVERRRIIIGMPNWLSGVAGSILDAGQTITGGLVSNRLLSKDQARLLRADNKVAEGAKTFADLGIEPTASDAVIGEYLWRFRKKGQYQGMIDSARQLRRN